MEGVWLGSQSPPPQHHWSYLVMATLPQFPHPGQGELLPGTVGLALPQGSSPASAAGSPRARSRAPAAEG